MVSHSTEHKDIVVSQDDHALYCNARCCCFSLVLIVLNTDFMALWLHLRSVFSSVFVPGS